MTEASSPQAAPEHPIPPDLIPWHSLVEQVAFNQITGCIIWLGPTDAEGYGVMSVDGERYMAHRVGYVLAKGPIAPGLVLDHLCVNPRCVNPDHLEPVTPGENNARGIGRPLHKPSRRSRYGPRNPERGYSERHARRLAKGV